MIFTKGYNFLRENLPVKEALSEAVDEDASQIR